jgi:hypothetical protein
VLASRPAQSKQATRINERVRFSQPASDPEKTRHGNNHLPPYSIRERPNASEDRHTARMTIVTLLPVNELNLRPKRKVTPEAPLFCARLKRSIMILGGAAVHQPSLRRKSSSPLPTVSH